MVAGGLGTSLAIVSPSVIDALKVFYTLLGVSLFVPLLAGLYLPSARTSHALSSMAAGVVCVLVLQFTSLGAGLGAYVPLWGLLASVTAFGVTFFASRAGGVR